MSDSLALEVVLFDLDDTLMAHTRAVELGLARARAAAGGVVASADAQLEFERWRALEEHHYSRYLRREIDFFEQRRERARGFLAPFDIVPTPEHALEWFETYMVGYRDNWQLFDDVIPTLDALDAALPHVRFGIITNGDINFQMEKLVATGLTPRIPPEAIIASGEVGYAKPDARIFQAAAKRFGTNVTACAYVGDRVHTDAVGAAKAGMRGIWLDREQYPRPEVSVDLGLAVPRLRQLGDLPGLLSPT